METLLDFGKAAAGMAVIMTVWFGLQSLVRRRSEEDVLDHLAHGCCGGCANRGKCTNKNERNQ